MPHQQQEEAALLIIHTNHQDLQAIEALHRQQGALTLPGVVVTVPEVALGVILGAAPEAVLGEGINKMKFNT
jgi:hypothetical protein